LAAIKKADGNIKAMEVQYLDFNFLCLYLMVG